MGVTTVGANALGSACLGGGATTVGISAFGSVGVIYGICCQGSFAGGACGLKSETGVTTVGAPHAGGAWGACGKAGAA